MCGRYLRRTDKQALAEIFHVRGDLTDIMLPDWNYNAAPSVLDPATFHLVIRQSREGTERELVMMKWGLIPFFARSVEAFKGYSTINARAETVATTPTFREPFQASSLPRTRRGIL